MQQGKTLQFNKEFILYIIKSQYVKRKQKWIDACVSRKLHLSVNVPICGHKNNNGCL